MSVRVDGQVLCHFWRGVILSRAITDNFWFIYRFTSTFRRVIYVITGLGFFWCFIFNFIDTCRAISCLIPGRVTIHRFTTIIGHCSLITRADASFSCCRGIHCLVTGQTCFVNCTRLIVHRHTAIALINRRIIRAWSGLICTKHYWMKRLNIWSTFFVYMAKSFVLIT